MFKRMGLLTIAAVATLSTQAHASNVFTIQCKPAYDDTLSLDYIEYNTTKEVVVRAPWLKGGQLIFDKVVFSNTTTNSGEGTVIMGSKGDSHVTFSMSEPVVMGKTSEGVVYLANDGEIDEVSVTCGDGREF